MTRADGRAPGELRPVRITRGFTRYAEGSVLIELGETRVLCTATVEERVPGWRKGSGAGWVTAEYDMLPRATRERTPRAAQTGRPSGRAFEIQRLIGRSLRAVVDLAALGERTIIVDCDVIQADGGTRTAAVTGGFVALVEALERLRPETGWERLPVRDLVAAVSVGVVAGVPLLDMSYEEDAAAEVDMNLVATASGELVELQGTGEGRPFRRDELEELLALGLRGIAELVRVQREALGELAGRIG